MSDEGDEGHGTTGSLELEQRDLRLAILEMSVVWRGRVGITLIIALCLGTLVVTGNVTGPGPDLAIANLTIFGGVVLFFIFVWSRIRARRLLRKIAGDGDRHASFIFGDEGVTFRTAGSTTATAYRSLVEYEEGPTAYVVYTAPGVGYVVPKRAFSSEGVARVGAVLAAHVTRRHQRSANKLILVTFAASLMLNGLWRVLEHFLTGSSRPMH